MMSKILKIIISVIILVILIFLFINRDDGVKTENTFRIGALESLTGSATYYGESSKKGVDLALEVASKKYPSIIFEIFHEDNQFNPKIGVDAYNKLRAERNIDAIITQTSPVAVAVKPLAEKDGILQMAVSASASTYSSLDDLSFRTTGDSSTETKVIAAYIKNNYKSTALLGMNNEIGVSSIKGIEEQLASVQIPIISKEMYPVETVDFRTSLIKLKQNKVDNVYLAGLASHVAIFLKQAEELGVDLDVSTFRTGEDPVLIKNAGKLAEKVVFTSGFDPGSTEPAVKEFVSLYKAKYQEEPNNYSAESYIGTMFVFDALAKCGKEKECIFNYLSNIKDSSTALGNVSFNRSGDISYPFFLKTVKDGQFVRYKE